LEFWSGLSILDYNLRCSSRSASLGRLRVIATLILRSSRHLLSHLLLKFF
jgi:hypothetical protein